ncbi:hypothetical protein [Streptomyces sp. 8L]|uniref:hypothetical protein n=1 Tax=Streptomyces sp. 8L TaxID=2877242 RepID=UPI001CD58EDA|nr:hypothetical protein [Streptomyces sp. 8L]MCA1218537.1 hypothetical protein [Streptomyces sp. 8L]
MARNGCVGGRRAVRSGSGVLIVARGVAGRPAYPGGAPYGGRGRRGAGTVVMSTTAVRGAITRTDGTRLPGTSSAESGPVTDGRPGALAAPEVRRPVEHMVPGLSLAIRGSLATRASLAIRASRGRTPGQSPQDGPWGPTAEGVRP